MAADREESLPGGLGSLRRLLVTIAAATLAVEFVGAVVLLVRFPYPGFGLPEALGHAAFHAVSAFCNARFTPFPQGLSRFDSDLMMNLACIALIVLGGFPVLVNLYRYPKVWRLTLHSKLALSTYAVLLAFSGTLAITISDGWGFLPALFHATSALGTVGLSLRPSAELGTFGKLLLIFPMFVGRLGPITFLVALSVRSRSHAQGNDQPPGNIAIG